MGGGESIGGLEDRAEEISQELEQKERGINRREKQGSTESRIPKKKNRPQRILARTKNMEGREKY